jgi:PTS system cellobiose-specific IIC component
MANKAMVWLEESFAPRANKISSNIWVKTIKDSLMQELPLVFVGSLVTVVAILQDFIPNFPNLWPLSSYSMGLIGVATAFLIPFNYMEAKKLGKYRFIAGLTGFCLFALIIRMEDVESLSYSALGAGGMFAAIITGVVVSLVVSLFRNFSFFSEDSSMPDFVRFWFDAMVPVVILIAGGWFLVYILNFDVFGALQSVFRPVSLIAETFPGFVIGYFLWCFLYSMGISTWLPYAVYYPIFLTAIQANVDAVMAGQIATNISTSEVWFSGWLAFGGTGATLTLVFMLAFSRIKQLKTLGRASIVPGILNINEPVVFGCIAWNPIMMIPMWIHGIALPIITYVALRTGLVPTPSAIFQMWYCPFPISTWIVSKSISGLVLLAVLVVVSVLIWLPFLKVYERQLASKQSNGGEKA